MKHKFALVLLAVVGALCLAFGLSGCGETPSEEPSEHVHSMTKIEKVDATCTADGTKEYWTCGKCHKNFIDEEGSAEAGDLTIPKSGHQMTKSEKVDATCTTDGTKEYWTCGKCHKNFIDEEGSAEAGDLTIPKSGHQMTKSEKVDATCTADGTKEYWTCGKCHKNFIDEEGSAEAGDLTIQRLAHTPEEYIEQEATCDIPGKEWQRCSVCHTPLSGEEEIPVLGHDWGEWEFNNDATCTVDGTETKKCKRAGCAASETRTRSGSALGHDYGEDGICRRENCGDKGGPITWYRKEDDKIFFGSYPQSEVKDEATVNALNAKAGALPTAKNAGGWTDYGYYAKKAVKSYMWYIDLEEKGEKYRGVYFTKYRPYYTELDGYTSTSYQDDNNYFVNQVYWFKYEPIEWRILEQKGDVALLVADLILDSMQYQHSQALRKEDGKTLYSNNYAESDIRAFLNETFYQTAFSDYQKSIIETTEVVNNTSTTATDDNPYVCENTFDHVFLLSYQDVVKEDFFPSDASRKLAPSAYAKAQGLRMESTGSSTTQASWWLRSPRINVGYYVHVSDIEGKADDGKNIENTTCGVVPALRLKTGEPVVREDGKIEFGSYPQTKVQDEAIASALTQKAGALPTAESAGAWTDYGYYNKGEVASYMWYIDLKEGGEKYRGVYFTQYRPNDTTDEGRTPNSFQDEHGYSTGKVYWFKFEPIVWRVLTKEQGVSLLMADLVLDAQDFYYSKQSRQQGNETVSPNRYAESHIRSWLNETFYETAFNGYQQSLIEITAVGCSSSESDPGGITWEVVQDKLFLLSEEEVANESYGFLSAIKKDEQRLLKSTDYAKSQNVYRTGEFGYKEYTNWWLRTPGHETWQAKAVNYGGKANLNAYCNDIYGVVPAMWICFSSGD